jgi:NADH-quinone oxidoreductase subunit I
MALLNLKVIKEIKKYFRDIYSGVSSLVNGMKVTGGYFIRPSEIVTQKYPENRDQLKMLERFKGELVMPHDENNQHACVACLTCERRCPNGSIELTTERVQGEDGRTKRVLVKYVYHLEMCTFCGLCVQSCDEHAITFSQEFEHAVFDRSKLTKQLNKPGSTAREKLEPEPETKPI